ncbi:hypothetical protein N8580_04135, partial [Akkermansiaceae bacterium]|nr:hypothetical protein [Akkermansiaceae bacterium]
MAVYANSPAVERAFSSHAPWSNGQVYWDTGGCCDGGGQRANVAAGFIVSTWNHVVLNKNGDTKAIWVNGVKVLEKTNTEDLPTEFTRFFIGTDSNSLNTVGLLDDMAIYADALSDAEIASLAAGDDPLSIVPPNDDTDGDGMPDAYESANGLNPAVDDAGDDLDADDVTNFTEYLNGTDPQDDDSDDDNLKDGVETNTGIWVSITDTGTDPLNSDSDGDTLSDGLENPDLPFVDAAQPGTNPNLLDTDGDTFSDSQELQLETDPTLDTSVPVAGEQELLVYYDFNGQTADQTGNAPDATFVGNAALTTGGMGASGLAGDESLDLMTANDGSAALVAAGNHLARVNLNNAAAVSFWLYKTQTAASSAFWLRSPSAGNNQRGFQAHATWSDGTTYFDVAGQTGGSARLTSAGFTFENQWQQFVFQKTSTGELQIWIDGTMQANSFDAPDLLPLDGDITLGAFNGLANSFSGRLDDFAVFLLKEGSGKAQTIEKRSPISLSMKAVPAPLRDNGNAQIILPSRVPFPQLTYLDQTGLAKKLPADGRPRLLLLWSADCTHCKKALPLFTSQAAAIRTAQLDVIALSVDGLSGPTADTAPTRDLIKASSFPFQWGLIDKGKIRILCSIKESVTIGIGITRVGPGVGSVNVSSGVALDTVFQVIIVGIIVPRVGFIFELLKVTDVIQVRICRRVRRVLRIESICGFVVIRHAIG